ncbi:MAG: hypothetical protein IID45_05575, partial [Planctomycetes bacterium]|nr:hypothetical protein [Planctomycetota bacterium]
MIAQRVGGPTSLDFNNRRYYLQNNIRLHQLLSARGLTSWQQMPIADPNAAKRTLVTATVVKDGQATVTLKEPGAYKLVCIAELPDGSKLKNEVGCVVRKADDLPGLALRLDGDQFETGKDLGGEIHSRFANARVLLTLRDSVGVRVWKTIQLKGSTARFSERLPQGLRYGCTVEVQYVDATGRNHIAEKFVRVIPRDRMLKIDVKAPETCAPGKEVTIDLAVNRREPIDLVVSVYDQSLLGIAADKSPDVRSFYLADERVRHTAARDRLRRLIGDVTIRELIQRAEKLLKDKPAIGKTPHGARLVQLVNYYKRSTYFYAHHIPLLLELAGVEARGNWIYGWSGWSWHYRFDPKIEAKTPLRLRDALGLARNGWRLHYFFSGSSLLLSEYHVKSMDRMAQSGGLSAGMMFRRGYGMQSARGDARFSVTGNGFRSHTNSGQGISGQSFLSHLPANPQAVELIDSDVDGVQVRRNFSDSAFWNAQVRTDKDGHARVTFKLPDSLTNWQVVVTAVSPRMHVGRAKARFRTFKPVMVWPMVPRIFTEGDIVRLYASVHNRTDKPQQIEVSLKVKNGSILSPRIVRIQVPAKGQVPVYWTFRPEHSGYTQLLMTAQCPAGSDASLKRLPVARLAAEQTVTKSGFCKGTATIRIPDGVNMNDAQLEVTLVPSLADDVVHSLDYLVQYPHGCVEQTMSRFLPAIRVAQTLRKVKIDNPKLKKKLPLVVAAGIKRLLQLQKPGGGWGWHGGSRTHEMMTPYALYGLLQAEKAGYDIPNNTAVTRGLNRLRTFIRSMNQKQTADRIYCMYVYSHRRSLQPDWWKFIGTQLKNGKLSDYALAMSLEMSVQKKKKPLADRLAAALRNRAHKTNGTAYWTSAGFSRWGNDRFEITAAAMKALVAYAPNEPLIIDVLAFFAKTKRGQRWNSTKDTAMIIFAICDYLATQESGPGKKRIVTVQVNDGTARKIRLITGNMPRFTIPGRLLHHGDNQIRFHGVVPGAMFRAVFHYWKRGRDIAPLKQGLTVTRKFFLLS